jgi:hypothetical protein
VVTPNNDTPYSWAWLDLRGEPYVLSVPAVPKDPYYVVQWIDLFTQNFAYVGVRSTGFDAGHYVIAGAMWPGAKPPGIREVFQAETEIVGTLTRNALSAPEHVPNVRAIQAQFGGLVIACRDQCFRSAENDVSATVSDRRPIGYRIVLLVTEYDGRNGTQDGSWRCPPSAVGVPPGDNGGNNSAHTETSRL